MSAVEQSRFARGLIALAGDGPVGPEHPILSLKSRSPYHLTIFTGDHEVAGHSREARKLCRRKFEAHVLAIRIEQRDRNERLRADRRGDDIGVETNAVTSFGYADFLQRFLLRGESSPAAIAERPVASNISSGGHDDDGPGGLA